MIFTKRDLSRLLGLRCVLCLIMVLCIASLPVFSKASAAEENGNVQHFKMLSNVEYTGKGQFQSQAQTLFTVKKRSLSDDQILYLLCAKNLDLMEKSLDSDELSLPKELSFVIDRKTKRLSGGDKNLAFLGQINNACVRSLEKVTKENIGQTWEQSFDLSYVDSSLPRELKFTLKAIQLKSDLQGEMVAVRALSEPFDFSIPKENGESDSVQCKTSAVYLFDAEIEDIYVSISVFEATAKGNDVKEDLRHEVATYKTNADGNPVDLSGLSKDFEKLVRKIGLREKSLKVEEEAILPQWAQSGGLYIAQVVNLCAATACEGALNPVATVFIPTTQVVRLQSLSGPKFTEAISIGKALARDVPGIGSMKIAVAPAFMGVGLGTVGAAAGGTVAIAAGGSSGSSSSRSPSTP